MRSCAGGLGWTMRGIPYLSKDMPGILGGRGRNTWNRTICLLPDRFREGFGKSGARQKQLADRDSLMDLRIYQQAILGVQADYDGLRIVPCIPDEIRGYTVNRLFRGVRYIIYVRRIGERSLAVDGDRIDGDLISYRKGKQKVLAEVTVWIDRIYKLRDLINQFLKNIGQDSDEEWWTDPYAAEALQRLAESSIQGSISDSFELHIEGEVNFVVLAWPRETGTVWCMVNHRS